MVLFPPTPETTFLSPYFSLYVLTVGSHPFLTSTRENMPKSISLSAGPHSWASGTFYTLWLYMRFPSCLEGSYHPPGQFNTARSHRKQNWFSQSKFLQNPIHCSTTTILFYHIFILNSNSLVTYLYLVKAAANSCWWLWFLCLFLPNPSCTTSKLWRTVCAGPTLWICGSDRMKPLRDISDGIITDIPFQVFHLYQGSKTLEAQLVKL